MDGLLLVDKPTGMTSFDVIRNIRRVANTRKIGHTGTLDPQASGLLPLVVGRCTKLANFLSLDVKEYDFEMELGVETETGDVEGEAVRECPWEHVSEEAIREACEQFIGEIEQVPPIYSAVKVNGKRAYELARKGEEFELEPRPVTIESLSLVSFEPPRAKLHTRCGSGTYVRALVRDLGGALGSCAYTTAIRRTVVGRFSLDEATPLAEITPENFSDLLLPPIELMREFPTYTVDESMCLALGYGQNIQPERLDVDVDSFVAVANEAGELVAVTVARETEEGLALRPKRVLKPQH
ncbi:tRNA pseudouridine(55) synthase TruB [Persicimonas caeni]|uniref:tRNA pseudouridine synthase B n=1 Tax=Persicimonas caeni TaxID=2292766 RepID=A0A4Y6Q113_PERCE|nr:tRNA pseudouridine(55) synthase TruB [Persicimonas caeni]QDG54264.1 tRNA pseudouridine(55) synthase TruB [Persicimonas caeni]QED35485.1 tRNA pseudouridine(55) synthase TruB [Persicimonas caeni]